MGQEINKRLKIEPKSVSTKWFEQPERRVTNRDLMSLIARNNDEDSLKFLYEKDITTDIDLPLLKIVRFNTDHKTKLTKIGCRIGDYELIPKVGYDHIYNLTKHTSKPSPKKAIPSLVKSKAKSNPDKLDSKQKMSTKKAKDSTKSKKEKIPTSSKK